MDETLYFYGEPGGKVSGPLGLGSIQVAVSAGRLGADVMLSRHGGEPWRSLEDVKSSGLDAFQPNHEEAKAEAQARAEKRALEAEAVKTAREAQADKEKSTPTPISSESVAGTIEIFGTISIFVGILAILGFLMCLGSDITKAPLFGCLALANILSGLLLYAVSEVLSRLKEIATILSRGK